MTFPAFALAPLAGIFITLSLKPFEFWPLAIVATSLYYLSLRGKTAKQHFVLAFLFSSALFLSGTSWVYVSIHDFGYTSVTLAGLLTLIFCLALALVNACIWQLAYSKHQLTSNILLFAAVGTLTESLRSWLFTGFPWLFIGYSQTESILSGWAPIFGVYGISFILYLSGAVLATIFSTKKTKPFTAITIITFSCWAISPFLKFVEWTEIVEPPISASLIQANISQHEKWQPTMRKPTMRLYQTLSKEEWSTSDIVIWPEAAIPAEFHMVENYFQQIDIIAKKNNSVLLSGTPYRPQQRSNSSTIHNSVVALGNAEGVYHKQYLVPFGEYVPFSNIVGRLMAFFELPLSTMYPGSNNQPALSIQDWQSRPLICYEIVYPGLTAKSAKKSDVLITVSNDSWFGNSVGPIQHLQMAQMRALENGRYLLRSTGNGISAIVNNKGKIQKQSKQFHQEVLRGNFYLTNKQTPWTQYGHWLIHFFYTAIIIYIFLVGKFKNKTKH